MWDLPLSTLPKPINNRDLNKACDKRWKNERSTLPSEKAKQIKPRWLRVERATSFFKSGSNKEHKPAYKEVKSPNQNRTCNEKEIDSSW